MRPDLARVVVVGSSCAGKTTLARSLARRSRVPHTELDSLYWGPGWTPVPPEEFRSRVRDVAAEPSWIVDGNYSVVRDIVWSRATALIWLGLSFPLVFSRAGNVTFWILAIPKVTELSISATPSFIVELAPISCSTSSLFTSLNSPMISGEDIRSTGRVIAAITAFCVS